VAWGVVGLCEVSARGDLRPESHELVVVLKADPAETHTTDVLADATDPAQFKLLLLRKLNEQPSN
jgi:hypothetical protein